VRRIAILGAVTLALLTGCSSSSNPPSEPATTLMVFAAASLKGTFTELGKQFETDNPGTSQAPPTWSPS
jgi:molybdate transport system substrate-binding protein